MMAGLQGKPTRGVPEESYSVSAQAERTDINTELPGKIVKFYPEDQTADIQPLVKTVHNGKPVSMPVLPKVPLNLPRSGKFAMTTKVEVGDFMKLAFGQRSMDEYLKDGSEARPASGRMHDLSDATANPIANPKDKKLSKFKNDRVSLRSEKGDWAISLTDGGKLELRGNGNEELVSLLHEWLTLFRDHTHNSIPMDQKAQAEALRVRLAKLKE